MHPSVLQNKYFKCYSGGLQQLKEKPNHFVWWKKLAIFLFSETSMQLDYGFDTSWTWTI